MAPRAELPPERARLVRETAASMCEAQRRIYLGNEAIGFGRGGITAVAEAAGVSRETVARGVREVRAGVTWRHGDRQRRPGGGRRTLAERFAEHVAATDPDGERDIVRALGAILGRDCYGDPCGTGTWTNVTAAGAAEALFRETGFRVSERSANRLAHEAGYSLQGNRKLEQAGEPHPLRDAQFHVIGEAVRAFELMGAPTVSVDTKAKVKLGRFHAGGREWRMRRDPRRAYDHDFALTWRRVYPQGHGRIPSARMGSLAVAVPYGVYDRGANTLHVTVGTSADTSEFAGSSLVNWWVRGGGRELHGDADELLVLCDGGGSNRYAGWLYKLELALAAMAMGLRRITVAHYPAGASKWNPVEHRGFGPVSVSCAGKPMTDLETMVGHYEATTNSSGLRVTCEVDYGTYVTDAAARRAAKRAGLPAPARPDAEALFFQLATIERPLERNETLSKLTYTIVLR